MRRFQRRCRFNQNAALGTTSCADHNRRRCCQSQSAGTGNDEHRNGNRQRKMPACSQRQPDNRRKHGNAYNGRYKIAAHLISQLGNRRFRRCCLIHQRNNLRQSCISANRSRFHLKVTASVNSAADNLVTDCFIYRQAFTRQRTFVQGTAALNDFAVHRHGRTAFYNQYIACNYLLYSNFSLQAVAFDKHRLRRKLHQRLNRIRGVALRPRLHKLA